MTGARSVVQAILALERPPAFVVDTGDCTELGWKAEVDQYVEEVVRPLEAAGIAHYALPRNHAARWSETATRYFADRICQAPALVRRDGVGLLLLNTGLPGEQHGHLERRELDEMALARSKMERFVPVFAFAHHPVIEGEPYLDDTVEVHEFLRGMGVAAVFVGHGHGWVHWWVNGVHQLMTGAAIDGAYRIVDVDETSLCTWGVGADGAEVAETRFRLPLRPERVPSLVIAQVRGGAGASIGIEVSASGAAEDLPVSVSAGGAVVAEVAAGEEPEYVAIEQSGLPAGAPTAQARTESPRHGVLLAQTRLRLAPRWSGIEWTFSADGSVFGSPALVDDTVFFATRAGSVHALRVSRPEELWKRELGAPIQAGVTFHEGSVTTGCASGSVFRLRASDGLVRWETRLPGPVRSTPTVAYGRAYVGCGDGVLRALDWASGEVLWAYPIGRLIESKPAVSDGCVVVGAWDQRVHCVRALTGEPLWSTETAQSVYYSPATSACAIRDGRAFCAAPDNTIRALDLTTGEQLWEAEGMAGYTSPTFTEEGTLVYGTMDGNLIGLDPAAGEDRFRVDLGAGTYNSSGVAVGNRIGVGSLHGAVLVADATTGAKLREVDLGDCFMFATPAFDGEWVAAGTMDCRVVALRV